MLVFNATTVVLCEVKSSPLYLLPLCVRYQKPLETPEGDEIVALTTHAVITVDELENREQNTVARPRSLDAYYETIVLLQKDC